MPQAKKYKVEIVSIINSVDNICTVEFKSLTGKFKYLPGQFLHLTLDEYDPSHCWPESRCFSMQSSPSEEFIKITFSIQGKFTQRMAKELQKGKIIDIKLPFGDLFQQDYLKENIVFIAGGTGITPFLSLFTDPSFTNYINPKLYFGVRNDNFNIYKNEMALAQKINPYLEITVLNQDKDGMLDINNIFFKNGISSTYFLSGPRIMISLFRSQLLTLGVNENLIKTDDWE